jgi:hypothetical protein
MTRIAAILLALSIFAPTAAFATDQMPCPPLPEPPVPTASMDDELPCPPEPMPPVPLTSPAVPSTTRA